MFICQMSTVICHLHSNPFVMYILYSLYDRMHPVPQKKHWNNSLSNINVYKGFGAPKELGHEVLDWKEGTHWAYGCWYLVSSMHNAYAASDAESNLYLVQYADLHMQFGEFNMHFWLYMGILGWGWSIIIKLVGFGQSIFFESLPRFAPSKNDNWSVTYRCFLSLKNLRIRSSPLQGNENAQAFFFPKRKFSCWGCTRWKKCPEMIRCFFFWQTYRMQFEGMLSVTVRHFFSNSVLGVVWKRRIGEFFVPKIGNVFIFSCFF